jgi:all-trans-retinol 13,14-reductase
MTSNINTSITSTQLICGTSVTAAAAAAAWLTYKVWKLTATLHCPNFPTSDDPTKQGFSMKKVSSINNIDVIIIGSGIGGLSTAALLAKQGKKVLVLEQHDIAGGNLHTFTEKGYEFDTGLHYIGGKIGDKSSSLRKQLDYITDGGVEWEPMDDSYDVAIVDNERFEFCAGWTKLKARLKTSFPNDTEAIDKYFQLVQSANNLFPVLLALKQLPEPLFKLCLRLISISPLRILNKTTKEVLESITTNRKLQGVLTYHYGDYGEPPERGAFAVNALIASHYRSGAYYPKGGPLVIAERIIHVIERWGGKVLVRAPVSSILIDNKTNRAYGVQVKGKTILAKTIISSVGAPKTFMGLVPSSHKHVVEKCIKAMTDPNVASNVSLMSMFVGINDEDHSLQLPRSNYWIHSPSWDHDKNMTDYRADHNKVPALFISFSSAKDPTYASRCPGKQVALVIGPCAYDDVEEFKDDRVKHRRKEYTNMKEKWTQIFMDGLLRYFPELSGKVEFVDFGTAVTNDFYLGTHRGAVYGLAHTPQRFQEHWLQCQTPIKNLLLSKCTTMSVESVYFHLGLFDHLTINLIICGDTIPSYTAGQDICSCGICGAMIGGYLCAYKVSLRCFWQTKLFW